MAMDIEETEMTLRICLFLASSITVAFTIYWLYNIYDIAGQFKLFYNKQTYCGNDVMEQEMFRYQLYLTTLPNQSGITNFTDTIREFQKTVTVVCSIGLVIIFFGFFFAIYLTRITTTSQYEWFFQFSFLTIIYLVLLGLVYKNLPAVDNRKNVFYDEEYKKHLESITKKIKNVLEGRNSQGKMFIEKGLSVFPEAFVNQLITRWQGIQNMKEVNMDIPEPVRSRSETLDNLERFLFEKNASGDVTKIYADNFVQLLRPSKNPIASSENVEILLNKTDIEIMNQSIRDWYCINDLTCSEDNAADMSKNYIPPLADISSYRTKYKEISKALFQLKLAGWALFVLLFYSFSHPYYVSENFPIYLILTLFILLILVIMYYLMIVRNKA